MISSSYCTRNITDHEMVSLPSLWIQLSRRNQALHNNSRIFFLISESYLSSRICSQSVPVYQNSFSSGSLHSFLMANLNALLFCAWYNNMIFIFLPVPTYVTHTILNNSTPITCIFASKSEWMVELHKSSLPISEIQLSEGTVSMIPTKNIASNTGKCNSTLSHNSECLGIWRVLFLRKNGQSKWAWSNAGSATSILRVFL